MTEIRNPRAVRYSPFAQALHWITAILVTAAFATGLGGSEERVYAHARDFDRQIHETLGLLVLVLFVLRVAWRARARVPEAAAASRWMAVAARGSHGALYLLLVIVPVTAIFGAWLQGHPLTLLGGFQVPAPMVAGRAAGAALAWLHPWLGDAIVWLAGVHALAGLFHHVAMRDDVLTSMLPRSLLRDRSDSR